MKLVYQVKDKPPFGKTLVFALQQLLAILAGNDRRSCNRRKRNVSIGGFVWRGRGHVCVPAFHEIQKPRILRLVFRVP